MTIEGKQRRKSPMHIFEFLIDGEIKRWAVPVVDGKKKIVLTTTADHVHESMRLHGQNTTTRCAMAICAKEHAHLFPHKKVHMIDYQYRTAYVVDQVDKYGWPTRCVRYSHYDRIAQVYDKRRGGDKKLLKLIEDNGGAIDVILRPYQHNTWAKPGRSESRGPRIPTGERTTSTPLGMGAKRRFANGMQGRPNPRTPEGQALIAKMREKEGGPL